MIGVRSRKMILKEACILLILSVLKEGVTSSCMEPVENIAVYEGTLSTLIYFPADPNEVAFSCVRTPDEAELVTIVNYDDTVTPACVADYAYSSSSGLTIRNATTTAQPGHEGPTSGHYEIQCTNGNFFIFHFLVVRQGPTCSCTSVNASSVQLTCSSNYAVSSYCTIDAVFTLYVGGISIATEKPNKTRDDSNTTYISTSTFTSAYSDSSNYECGQTFTPPINCQFDILAQNAPNFNQHCSFACPLETTTTTQPPTTTTTQPLTTTQPPTSTTQSLSQTQSSSTTTSRSPPPEEDCNRNRKCQPDGTDNTGIYIQRVVKAQLYTRSDKCCSNNQTCGVVVTLQNGNRYLIHDAVCNDNSLKMAVVAAFCMSSDWKLTSERRILLSNVGAFVLAGNLDSCNAMMSLL